MNVNDRTDARATTTAAVEDTAANQTSTQAINNRAMAAVHLQVPVSSLQLGSLDSDQSSNEDAAEEIEPEQVDVQPQSDQDTRHRRSSSCNNTAISISTMTVPTMYNVSWEIDESSLNYSMLRSNDGSNTNGQRDVSKNNQSGDGVLEALLTENGMQFKLELCITGWRNSSRGYSAFYLTIPSTEPLRQGGPRQRVMARYTVRVNDTAHSKRSSIRDDFHLGVGFPNMCTVDALDESRRANDGRLALNVEIEIFKTESRINRMEGKVIRDFHRRFPSTTPPNANSILAAMYRDSSCCDVSIVCRTADSKRKAISAHRCILVHSSVVFERMLSNDAFVESIDGTVDLEQSLWTHATIKEMVRFLYLGEIDTEFVSCIERLFELFRIAEYYQISSLIEECCRHFLLTLSVDTVCLLLLKLKDDAFSHVEPLQFIRDSDILWIFAVQHIQKVKKTDGYQLVMRHAPQILSQLIDRMADERLLGS